MEDEPLEAILDDYESLTDRLSDLLKQEQAHLNAGGSLEDTVDAKRELLEAITALNARLQAVGRERPPVAERLKSRMETVQNRLMSVLKLDRSVEKAYLSLSARTPAPPQLDPAPGRVGQAYKKQVDWGR